MVGAYPVQCALHLAVGTIHAALAVGVIFCLDFGDVAVLVFGASRAFHDVGIFQAHLFSGSHAEEFLRCILHKVVTLNPEISAEGDGVCAVSLVFRVVHRFHLFGHALRIVGNHQFHRVHHCRNSQRPFVQVVAHGSFQQSHVVQGIEFMQILGTGHPAGYKAHGYGNRREFVLAHLQQANHPESDQCGYNQIDHLARFNGSLDYVSYFLHRLFR